MIKELMETNIVLERYKHGDIKYLRSRSMKINDNQDRGSIDHC